MNITLSKEKGMPYEDFTVNTQEIKLLLTSSGLSMGFVHLHSPQNPSQSFLASRERIIII